MTIAYSGYGNPTPDSTDLTVQRPDFGTYIPLIYRGSKIKVNWGFVILGQVDRINLNYAYISDHIRGL